MPVKFRVLVILHVLKASHFIQFPVDWELDPNFPKLDLNFSLDPNFPTCFYKLQAFPAVQSGPTLKTATLSSKGKGSVEGNDSMGRS